jgi:hypothetical protein
MQSCHSTDKNVPTFVPTFERVQKMPINGVVKPKTESQSKKMFPFSFQKWEHGKWRG